MQTHACPVLYRVMFHCFMTSSFVQSWECLCFWLMENQGRGRAWKKLIQRSTSTNRQYHGNPKTQFKKKGKWKNRERKEKESTKKKKRMQRSKGGKKEKKRGRKEGKATESYRSLNKKCLEVSSTIARLEHLVLPTKIKFPQHFFAHLLILQKATVVS